jgi:hypothetical protein
MPQPMTRTEREAFLRDPRPAILSIPQDGKGPLSSPVWFDFDPGGDFWVLMQSDSRKGELMQVGTCVSLCAQQETKPYKYVSVEGPVVSVATYKADKDFLAMADRYLGTVGAREFVDGMREKTAKGQGVKVTIKPERWLSLDYSKP